MKVRLLSGVSSCPVGGRAGGDGWMDVMDPSQVGKMSSNAYWFIADVMFQV